MKLVVFLCFLSLALAHNCFNRPQGRFDAKGENPLCVPCAPPVAQDIFQDITNHIAVVVDGSEEAKPGHLTQLDVQKTYWNRMGLGPWKEPAIFRNYTTYYYGQETPLNINIHLTTSRDVDDGRAFSEIFELVDKSKNFFRDYYDEFGPSMVYRGVKIRKDENGVPIINAAEFVTFAEEQGLEIVFHLPGAKDAYFFWSGYHLNEVVWE